MTLELDHMFICTAVDAPEADLLVAFGLTEGTPNSHPGQGTACRRFFFRNAMLELVWVHDESEARSPLIAPARLWEGWRYRSTGYSPFGICVRPRSIQHGAPQPVLPFATWEYRPPYLPPEQHIDVASETSKSEPLLFATPFGGRPDAKVPTEHRQLLVHPIGVGKITAVHVTLPPDGSISHAARAVQQTGSVSFGSGSEHLAEVEFDHGEQGQSKDFRPTLPLRFRW
jgi:hypothetical protein